MTVQTLSACAPHAFDAATAVTREADGRASGQPHEAYWAFVGPFGGATAATLLRAVTSHPEAAGEPLALTVNYAAPIAAGPFDLEVRRLRANRSTQHWSVLLSQEGAEPAAIATVVLAERRESWSHQPLAAPGAPPPGAVPLYERPSTANWVGQYAFRFARGAPDFDGEGPGETRTEVWVSDAAPRAVDHLSLAAMADAFFGRIFHARRGIVPFGTVSMTVHFHASVEDLAAEPITTVLGTADARAFHRSYGDQTGELWSPTGRLLATTQQVFYFKA
jgi:acyl-coenzyme A thioesterase PaaI-like protein